MIYSFSDALYKDENDVVSGLLDQLIWSDQDSAAIHQAAIDLVEETRAQKGGGRLESFLQEFSLNTEEGLAMMCLAEALLRIPDAHTANLLIKDKVVAAQWLHKQGRGSKDWMAKAAGLGMALTRKTLDSALSRLGEPVIREAMIKAMQMMGRQFVLGTDIEDAISNAKQWEHKGYRMSYDILGEGARDAETAERYFESYSASIDSISANNGHDIYGNAGISVKLSALHPRYTYSQCDRCVPEVAAKLEALALKAAAQNTPLTVDAEEANRLDLSIAIFESVLASDKLKGWEGFGLAVQAYQKRALPLIEHIIGHAQGVGRKIQMRLVKGAYWDSEVKHAQIDGLSEYPVFTRKTNTDLSFLTCAQRMMQDQDTLYPMFATHNAHTIAAIRYMADVQGTKYEFQRLHGMGESVYGQIIPDNSVKVSVYAPVGPHRDLLPYLVRRLLENGANSSFVNQILDGDLGASEIVQDPVSAVRAREGHKHPLIPLPQDIFGQNRTNSKGFDLDDPASSGKVIDYVQSYRIEDEATSIIEGKSRSIDGITVDEVFSIAEQGFRIWSREPVAKRARKIEKFSDLLEDNMNELMAILVHEAGKTFNDARDEIREAVDFCRYYAVNAKDLFDGKGTLMPGYTGEENRLTMQGRGVFVCISPWNFPLAIFTGQIVAALVAGNTVLAKPASQTRLIATRTVELMHKAGIPVDAIHLLLGDRQFGADMVAHHKVSGVAFTGSTATAKRIQKSLAENNPGIVPFIAETGGQNAMIVDSSALPEQVIDDVVHSAFGSAGQRCSALRVLYVQDDIADTVIGLLKGAMAELVIGDPSKLSTDVGYIIDERAKATLDQHIEYIEDKGTLIAAVDIPQDIPNKGRVFAPIAYEIPNVRVLKGEVFGPVLHVIRFSALELDDIIEQINGTEFGLTFGLHSRIQKRHDYVTKSINAGNLYVNRSTTGAIVGVQPFGGMGLSGTGPKAGGPHYLNAFAVEKVVSTDTTAMGGNASLISLSDD